MEAGHNSRLNMNHTRHLYACRLYWISGSFVFTAQQWLANMAAHFILVSVLHCWNALVKTLTAFVTSSQLTGRESTCEWRKCVLSDCCSWASFKKLQDFYIHGSVHGKLQELPEVDGFYTSFKKKKNPSRILSKGIAGCLLDITNSKIKLCVYEELT